MAQQLVRRARRLSGLPASPPETSRPWWRRVLTNGWTWTLLVLLVLGAVGLFDMYQMMHPDQVDKDGTVVGYGITNESFIKAAQYAWPTALVWSCLFLLFDRFRRQNFVTYLVAFIWGGCIATWFSVYVNTWAGGRLGVSGGDPTTAPRAAIFSAPFVEEVSKAAIIFGIALFVRYRLVSVLQTVVIAGLSAIGFAFVENIIYYARIDNYTKLVPDFPDPEAAVQHLVMLRGVYTSFGHPLFTAMTGVAIGIGLRHRSKLVRVAAPLAGFVIAAGLHMTFNSVTSLFPDRTQKMYWFGALAGVVMALVSLIGVVFTEGRRVRARLNDFAAMGWLTPAQAKDYSSLWRRFKMLLVACSQPRRLPATWSMMRDITELAYLRDQMDRGLVDAVGNERAAELLDDIAALEPRAVSQVAGERFRWPNLALVWRRIAPIGRRRRAESLPG